MIAILLALFSMLPAGIPADAVLIDSSTTNIVSNDTMFTTVQFLFVWDDPELNGNNDMRCVEGEWTGYDTYSILECSGFELIEQPTYVSTD